MIITMSCLTSLRALGRPICSRKRGRRTVWHWTRLSPTACKSSLLFLVAESIRQLKWVWFFQQGRTKEETTTRYTVARCSGVHWGPLPSGLESLCYRLSLILLYSKCSKCPTIPLGRGIAKALIKPWQSNQCGLIMVSANRIRHTISAGTWVGNFEVDPK